MRPETCLNLTIQQNSLLVCKLKICKFCLQSFVFQVELLYFSSQYNSYMKKVFRVLLIIIVLLVVVVGLFALFINYRAMPIYKVEQINVHVQSTPERIANGRKMASMLCFS